MPKQDSIYFAEKYTRRLVVQPLEPRRLLASLSIRLPAIELADHAAQESVQVQVRDAAQSTLSLPRTAYFALSEMQMLAEILAQPNFASISSTVLTTLQKDAWDRALEAWPSEPAAEQLSESQALELLEIGFDVLPKDSPAPNTDSLLGTLAGINLPVNSERPSASNSVGSVNLPTTTSSIGSGPMVSMGAKSEVMRETLGDSPLESQGLSWRVPQFHAHEPGEAVEFATRPQSSLDRRAVKDGAFAEMLELPPPNPFPRPLTLQGSGDNAVRNSEKNKSSPVPEELLDGQREDWRIDYSRMVALAIPLTEETDSDEPRMLRAGLDPIGILQIFEGLGCQLEPQPPQVVPLGQPQEQAENSVWPYTAIVVYALVYFQRIRVGEEESLASANL